MIGTYRPLWPILSRTLSSLSDPSTVPEYRHRPSSGFSPVSRYPTAATVGNGYIKKCSWDGGESGTYLKVQTPHIPTVYPQDTR
ncbi:hypothetical protein M422DRAFT_34273 [Sphaerobolus stellatus SS14]|uniref:Uncharacterized protein n=1 Tax=Sphaerobolus stellatus (strain SS14) TaxID=990650 RepID=A0A0C9UN61_SPHS4|nr:hypothetical protein M422DRAFT_34273 [Sphaerobolus stellatus SS14]